MAADQEVIREFLVSLGFKVDEAGLRKFTGALGTSGGGVAGVALTASKAVIGIAVAAEAMVTAFSSSMEKLYYASKRTNASVENIQGMEYGFRRIGLGAGVAREALEGMAAAVRMNPGIRGIMDSLVGHSTAGMDQSKAMIELVERLSAMPHYVGARFAQMFGLDEKTFLMLKDGLPELIRAEQERIQLNRTAGVDAQAAAEAGKEYANSLRAITERLDVLGQRLSIELLPLFRRFNGVVTEALDSLMHFKSSDLKLGTYKTEVDGLTASFQELIKSMGAAAQSDTAKDIFATIKESAEGASKAILNLISGVLSIGSGNWRKAGETLFEGLKGAIKNAPGTVLIRKGAEATDSWLRTFLPGGANEYPGKVAPATTMVAEDKKMAPLGIRQNNPGNLRSWGNAQIQNGFARFSTAQEGLTAMAANLARYADRGLTSVRGIISRWAPASENNTNAYVDAVAKQLGVNPDSPQKMKDPMTVSKVMDAIIRHENGYNPYGATELLAAASSQAQRSESAGRQVTINQKTDIHVNGVADPSTTGSAVSREQSRVNADIVRNAGGSIQ